MTPKEKKEKPIKDDSLVEDIFDAYKQAIILFFMTIIYNIIAGGVAFLGYYLAQQDNVEFTQIVTDLMNDPLSITEMEIHYGLYIIAISVVLFIIGFAAAFLFTASRNDRIAKPLGFFKAYFSTWGILFQFAVILVVFGGIYFGVTYAAIPTLTLVVGIIALVVAALTPMGMIFRVIDYLLELE